MFFSIIEEDMGPEDFEHPIFGKRPNKVSFVESNVPRIKSTKRSPSCLYVARRNQSDADAYLRLVGRLKHPNQSKDWRERPIW
jgi:hypothetical protein